ncbi:MAG: hypothetical protein GVY13_07110 [Alphaproteobacteria bacterium]|jgi:hypothetical protein|nr:hypothetical protein [Alphaproteobacteria bacterium]
MRLSKLADPFRVVGRTFGLWSEDGEARDTAAAHGAGHQRTRSPSALETLDFSWLTLDEVLRSEPGLLATKLHVITLRQFRESIGEEWDRLADRVGMIADGVVRRFLGPKNFFGRYSDDTFILSFSALSEAEGRRQAVLVANELMHRLIGERFAGAQILVTEVDTEVLLDGEGGLSEALVEEALTEAEPVEMFSQRFGTGIVHNLVEIDAGKAKAAADDLTAGTLDPRGPSGPAKKPDPVWVPLVWPPEVLKRRLPERSLAVKPGETVPDGIDILFRPTWTARWQMVDAYLALPRRRGGGPPAAGDHALPRDATAGARANLDYALLYAALAELSAAVERGRTATFICPIRFGTLVPPYWATVPDVLRCFSDATRQRHLLIEVTHIPQAATAEHMMGLARMIRPLCRDILVRTDLARPRMEVMSAARPAAIGAAMPPGRTMGDADNHVISAFIAAAADQRVYIWDIADRGVLQTATADPAVGYANGPALSEDMAESAGPFAVPARCSEPAKA